MESKIIFGHDDNGTDIEWTWDVSPKAKMYWKTWKPKVSDVEILSKVSNKDKNRISKNIIDDINLERKPKFNIKTFKRST
jgi:hypothetical protein|tara:strand:+ start:232 stop:471 length:240 start_codon:yes stop_codon:yes gene_type:complete